MWCGTERASKLSSTYVNCQPDFYQNFVKRNNALDVNAFTEKQGNWFCKMILLVYINQKAMFAIPGVEL